jgi:oxygen-independent coproporphyrinogen-3 oxidase
LNIYIHFPFCKRKCLYCDFASEDRNLDRIDSYINALTKEFSLREELFHRDCEVNTVYIGGGTPNLLGVDNFIKIVKKIKSLCGFDKLQEFTIEINPGISDINLFKAFREYGVNRVSVGCQSFNDAELKVLGRIHNTADIFVMLDLLEDLGFNNVNLDLIYGIPGQTLWLWEKSLKTAISTDAVHLSLYNLTYEPNTPLTNLKNKGEIIPLTEEQEWEMYDVAHKILKDNGFVHYEISNWAKEGCQSIHNSAYWDGNEYLGFGISAHSFTKNQNSGEFIRSWNVKSIDSYIKFLNENKLPIEQSEILSRENKIGEYFLLGLRTRNGINLNDFKNITGSEFSDVYEIFLNKIGQQDKNEYIYLHNNFLRLTHKGWFICDYLVEKFLEII